MNARFFLDTNVFVYTFDEDNPEKRNQARDLVSQALSESRGITSYQVVQEFLNVALKKFANPLTAADAERYLTIVLEPLCEVFAGFELYHQAIDIGGRWQYGFYDALVIAAAIQAECSILYSEDLQHGRTFGGLRIVNPFLESPSS